MLCRHGNSSFGLYLREAIRGDAAGTKEMIDAAPKR